MKSSLRLNLCQTPNPLIINVSLADLAAQLYSTHKPAALKLGGSGSTSPASPGAGAGTGALTGPSPVPVVVAQTAVTKELESDKSVYIG